MFEGRWTRRLLLAAAGAGVFGLLAFAILWWRICACDACPSVDALEKYTPRQTSKVFAADGRLVGELGLERRTLVDIKDIPQPVRNAFLVIEDKRFYQHHGIDYRRLFGAMLHNIRAMG